jgi:hypothetical protein
MENTKVLYQVNRSRPVSYQTAAKLLQRFQSRIQQESTSYSSSFNVPSDIADKLTIVAEELQKLSNSSQPDKSQPSLEMSKEKKSHHRKKRSAEEVLASEDDEEEKGVALSLVTSNEEAKPMKKKQKKAHKENK